ncbi:MAG: carboxy terminal-processing peptidase [Verrucomicrobiota bacterium]|jgi:carboxyl-terminal processing protease|nr:carboxy terminal-processing peptidase [Verrucomicrobiota bacterium]HJN83625.1 carboxy terminal-processing peptidase [Verrucomicrobiota bacterium]
MKSHISVIAAIAFLAAPLGQAVELSEKDSGKIARVVGFLLSNTHFKRTPLNDDISQAFLRKYMESLDYSRMVFLQSDYEEFEAKYGTLLDNLTKRGDVSPANEIHKRYFTRLKTAHSWLEDIIWSDFDFTIDESFVPDRTEANWPANEKEARDLWRKRIKYEVLGTRLGKRRSVEAMKAKANNGEVIKKDDGTPVKPYDIKTEKEKILRRYERFLRVRTEMDSGDVLQVYLTALSNGYDPHSDYFSPRKAENFEINNIKLSLTGIGARLQWDDGYTKLIELVPGGPAIRSKKLKPGDRIIAVAQGEEGEAVDVIEMELDKVVDKIRGEKGTLVRLTIIPADAADDSETREVRLIRDKIKLTDSLAKAQVIDYPEGDDSQPRLGVINLPQFYENCARDVALILDRFKDEKVSGLVLDLRRNGGGLLPEAVKLAGLFIEQGPMVQVIDSRRRKQVLQDKDTKIGYDGPMIVLVGKLSASASEIVAAALQDYGRALIVGSLSTHGKGTVQTVMPLNNWVRLPDSGKLKLTVSKFYRVVGSTTQKQGVIPDLILPSPYDYMEIGEATLPNCLEADHTQKLDYRHVNKVAGRVEPLTKLSNGRIKGDQDFAYILEDIETLKERLKDKSISLNETKRLAEKDEEKTKRDNRKKERKTRGDAEETVFDLTIKMIKTNTKLGEEVENEEKPIRLEEDPEDGVEIENEEDQPKLDPHMRETLHILHDYIKLLDPKKQIAVKENDDQAEIR